MRDQRFGIEIELTGLTRCQASKVVGDYFQTTPVHVGGGYDSYSIRDGDDRIWKVMSDASIHCECRGREAGSLYAVEVVSPICQYGDIETIQEIVQKAGVHFFCSNVPAQRPPSAPYKSSPLSQP